MERMKCRNRKWWVQRKTPAPAPAASSSAPLPPWIELPGDITANIMQRLGAEGMLRSAQKVCSSWWKVCKDPAIWRVIYLRSPDLNMEVTEKYTAMCRRAVDRSQGQLVDLTIKFFGDGELINYVADRSQNLKRLKLVCCNEKLGGLIQAVEKLGQLEELRLTMIPWIYARHIEAIGKSCPNLKLFSCKDCVTKFPLPPDSEDDDIDEGLDRNHFARAIGKCMPNLHHLRLTGHEMQNEGLEAILDGCPQLESLQILRCFGLNLTEDLRKRCCEQIKDLTLPNVFVCDVDYGDNDYDYFNANDYEDFEDNYF